MVRAFAYVVLAVMAGVLGFGGVLTGPFAPLAVGLGKILFGLCLTMAGLNAVFEDLD